MASHACKQCVVPLLLTWQHNVAKDEQEKTFQERTVLVINDDYEVYWNWI